VPPDNNNGYTIQQENVLTDLDPDLQKIILIRQQGGELPAHLVETVTDNNQVFTAIDVIARLKPPGEPIPGLWVVRRIGPFVTGLVDVDRIAEVRQQVDSLKAARALTETLSNSVPEISASQAQIRARVGRRPVDGSNVIVGFVDHACDFSHPNFRQLTADKRTRILYLWDQRGGTFPDSPEDFGYGREFSAAAIDFALENADPADGPSAPHQLLGYELEGAHGTWVMDVAVGNGGGENPPGVAPRADIIFVESELGNFGPGESVGNSRHLVDAVQYIFDRAKQLNRPAVVNISLSTDAGPHDGSTPFEQALDIMLQTPGRAIVMAAGNSANNRKHLRRRVYPGRTCTLVWNIPANDQTSNKVEMWYDGFRALELTLRSEQGVVIGPFPLGTTHTIHRTVDNEEQVAGNVFHRFNDSGNGDNNIVVVFEPIIEPGRWQLELTSTDSPDHAPFDVDAWIERDGGQNSRFPEQQLSDGLCTLGTLACGASTIVVSAYDVSEPHGIMESSGAGPTRDGKLKPEVSAPGVNIRAARPLTNTTEILSGGTSLAAPHVSGLVALLMHAAGTFMTIDQTRALVMNSIRKFPPSSANAWDPRFGAGRINVAESVFATPPPPPPPPLHEIAFFEHEESAAVEFAGVGVSVETVTTVVAPVFTGPPEPPDTNGGSPASHAEGEEPLQNRLPFTTGH
jgi:subtilisin family serine protease